MTSREDTYHNAIDWQTKRGFYLDLPTPWERKPGSSLQGACLNSLGAARALDRQWPEPLAKRSVPGLVNEAVKE